MSPLDDVNGPPPSVYTHGVVGRRPAIAGTNGEIICLDKFNYGGTTISQSITISCGDGLWEATGGFIQISTPAGADVVIEGLVIDGLGFSGSVLFMNGQGLGAGSVAVKIGNSQITGNVNGLAVDGTGQILTLGGNQLHSNLSNGSFTGRARGSTRHMRHARYR